MIFAHDAHLLWRKWSTRIAGIQLTSAVAWWALLPAEWKAAVPNWVLLVVVAAFAAGFVGAQAVRQPKLDPARKDSNG